MPETVVLSREMLMRPLECSRAPGMVAAETPLSLPEQQVNGISRG